MTRIEWNGVPATQFVRFVPHGYETLPREQTDRGLYDPDPQPTYYGTDAMPTFTVTPLLRLRPVEQPDGTVIWQV